MTLFDVPQAEHFCKPVNVAAGLSQSLTAYHSQLSTTLKRIKEGDLEFTIHRANLINSVERWLAYGLAHYRRATDMLIPISAPWAHVTLYYSSFFAANALLGMFGGWVGFIKNGPDTGPCVVDMVHGTIGAQQLQINRKVKAPKNRSGSHRLFWHLFYDATAAASLQQWAPIGKGGALNPVNNDVTWQIEARNAVNYDMFDAWAATVAFNQGFRPNRVRQTLSGPVAQQLQTTEQMLELAIHFAGRFSLAGFGLSGCGVTGTRASMQRQLVKRRPPNVANQSEIERLLQA